MATIRVKFNGRPTYTTSLRLSELVPYWREIGMVEHPNRPRFPATLWMFDLARLKIKAEFPDRKPIRITLDSNRGLIDDT